MWSYLKKSSIMIDNYSIQDLNNVSIGFDKVAIMKFDRELPTLSGSSRFECSYFSYKYNEKVRNPQSKPLRDKSKKSNQRIFTINKKKVIQKSIALSKLKQSQKFMAFYSISFPIGFDDRFAVECLNTWLTKLRQNSLKFQYLWVAERQKNGTIHFHMLINKWLNIRVVNFMMAQTINFCINKNKLFNLNFDRSRYNGVDVVKVRNARDVSKYITKYATKQISKFNCRAWSCDYITSALFVRVCDYFGNVIDKLENFLFKSGCKWFSFENDFCLCIFTDKEYIPEPLKKLISINNKIAGYA